MRTIVVDTSYIGHQARFTMKGLTTKDDMAIGVIFGVLNRILSLGLRYRSNKFVFCFDSPTKTGKRIRLYKEYKAQRRPKTPEEVEALQVVYTQLSLLRSFILPILGFNNLLYFEGYESDDIMGQWCQDHKKDNIVLVTGDQDMYQLLEGRRVIQTGFKSTNINEYTEVSLMVEHKVTPAQWILVKAIAGCNSDNVQGLYNVGYKTAADYLNGKLKPTTKAYEAIKSPSGKEIIERNLPLVTLPFPGLPTLEYTPDKFSRKGFKLVCEKYEFDTFLEPRKLYNWRDFFLGDMK